MGDFRTFLRRAATKFDHFLQRRRRVAGQGREIEIQIAVFADPYDHVTGQAAQNAGEVGHAYQATIGQFRSPTG